MDELVRRHRDRVYTLVRGIVRHDQDADDVTQETWIAVVRHLDTFQEGALFTTWLHRIAVRKCYDALRRRVPDPVAPDEGAAAQLQARDTDPHWTQLQRSALLEAITGLDENFRAAVLLVDVLGVSVEEAAGALQVAPGTVKSRVFRGRAQLAAALGTHGMRDASK